MKKTGKILAALGLASGIWRYFKSDAGKSGDTDRIAQGVYIGNIDVRRYDRTGSFECSD